MRKSISIVAVIAALTFLGACGTSGGDDDAADTTTTAAAAEETTTTEAEETTTTEAEDNGDAVDVEEWAGSFCGSFSTWLDEIETASSGVSDNVTPGDVQSAKDAIAGLFGAASDATQTLVAEIEDAGAPDIEDGDQLVEDLIEKFNAFDEAALDAKADSEALDTNDLTTFQADAEALTTRFQDEVNTVAESFDEIDADYPSPELNEALTSACNF